MTNAQTTHTHDDPGQPCSVCGQDWGPARNEAIRDALRTATLPYTMARAVRPVLKQTPEYEQALAEGRSRKWLEVESISLGHALAEIVVLRLDDLDPDAGS